MSASAEKILEQALDLPIEARLTLIDRLLQSTNLPIQSEIDQAWSKEVAHRSQSLDSGETRLIPGEEVFAKIRNWKSR